MTFAWTEHGERCRIKIKSFLQSNRLNSFLFTIPFAFVVTRASMNFRLLLRSLFVFCMWFALPQFNWISCTLHVHAYNHIEHLTHFMYNVHIFQFIQYIECETDFLWQCIFVYVYSLFTIVATIENANFMQKVWSLSLTLRHNKIVIIFFFVLFSRCRSSHHHY